MDYKDIYYEIMDVLWGKDNHTYNEEKNRNNKDEEGVCGVKNGYIFHLDTKSIFHKRALRLFKKFADKLYLDTKDEYIIKIIQEACGLIGDIHDREDLSEIAGTSDDPTYMFDDYKPEDAIEPTPEDRYSLFIRKIHDDGSSDYEIINYKYYEEAKDCFDQQANDEKEKDKEKHDIYKTINKKLNDDYESEILIDEEKHFKTNRLELLLTKTKQ